MQQVTQNPDAIRGLAALPAYGDVYLYVVRPLSPGLIDQLQRDYRVTLAGPTTLETP